MKKNYRYLIAALTIVVAATGATYGYSIATSHHPGNVAQGQTRQTSVSTNKAEEPQSTAQEQSEPQKEATQQPSTPQTPQPAQPAPSSPKSQPSRSTPAPPSQQIVPVALFTSGQTFCDSSITWGSIVEASFAYYNGSAVDIRYQIELKRGGNYRIISSGSMNTGASGAFGVRPAPAVSNNAGNVLQGDAMYIHIVSPFDVYSKPYAVIASEGACTVY